MQQAILLAAIAGYADAAGYLRFGAFAGMMTGNTVLMGIAALRHAPMEATIYLGLIGLFFVGVVATASWRQTGHRARDVILVEGALLVLCEMVDARWPVALLVVAMGLQNGVASALAGLRINTTFVTGTLSQFAEGLVRRLGPGAMPDPGRPVAVYGWTWLAYAVGAAGGAAGYDRLRWPLLVPAVVLVWVFVRDITRPPVATP